MKSGLRFIAVHIAQGKMGVIKRMLPLEPGLVPQRWQIKDLSVTSLGALLQCGCPHEPQHMLPGAGEMSPPHQWFPDPPGPGVWCPAAAEHIWVPEPPVGAWPERGLGLLLGNRSGYG